MKKLNALLAGAAMLLAVSAAYAADPVIGTWTLNPAKTVMKSGPMPKSQVRTYAEAPGGGTALTVKIVAADGSESTQKAVMKVDGKPGPFEGAPWDALSSVRKDANTVDFTLYKGGKPIGGGVRTVSADGKTMTIRVTNPGPGGAKVEDTMVFDRK
jgi:hypothetical protein